MLYGEQWSCGCGWGNLFLRRKCRNCGLPACLAVGREGAGEVVAALHAGSAAARAGRGGAREGEAGADRKA